MLSLYSIFIAGNFFVILPELPPTVQSLRLSVNGDENPFELIRSLEAQPYLKSINLQLTVRDASIVSATWCYITFELITKFCGY